MRVLESLIPHGMSRIIEAALPMNTSHDALRGHLQKALNTAHGAADSYSANSPSLWQGGVFPSHVVYAHQGQLYKRSYVADMSKAGVDPTITLGNAKPVHAAYVDSKAQEAESILMDSPDDEHVQERDIPQSARATMDKSDFAGKGTSYPIQKPEDVAAALHSIGRRGSGNYTAPELKSRILAIAKRKGFAVPKSDESVTVTLPEGTEAVLESAAFCAPVNVKEAAKLAHVPIKIIGPGWGSMAYYSKEMLKRDGPKVYTKGTPMFWNHQTATEEAERPEGNLDNLAAVLTKDAEWMDSGPKGPGLYSEAKVFSDYAQQVAEKGGHIGVSINAAIKGKEGSAEGRTGRIAEQLVRAYSADFVTRAGAGGAPVVPVQEADRGTQESATMTEQEVKEKADLVTENTALKARLAKVEESQNHVLAIATVAATLREAGIPFRQRILERACANPVMKEGKVDPEWVKSVTKDLSEGVEASVEGFGEVHHEGGGDGGEPDPKKTNARLKEALKHLGVPEAGLDFAVAGRG